MDRRSLALLAFAFGLSLAGGCTVRGENPGIDAFFVTRDSGPCTGRTVDCNGECVDVIADSRNCGSCGNVCPSGTSCAVGSCDCMAPMLGCGGTCLDPMTDHGNCGTCGNVCSASQECQAGHCVTMCTNGAMPGLCSVGGVDTCVDMAIDMFNCGTCGTTCTGDAVCVGGACTCLGGQMSCGGHCVDTQTDPLNCGACISSCGGASGTCAGGRCTACGMGLDLCGTSPPRCVDTQTSTLHCGMCGHACGALATCNAGTCTCPAATTDCTTACADLMTDPAHCGACGHACATMAVCTAGACVCPMSLTSCGSACVDTQTDHANCGSCGNACPAAATCMAGACACTTAGLTACGTTCVNTQTSATNCGTCGNNCGTGGTCTAGVCTCGTGFMQCDGVHCSNVQTDPANCGTCGHACTTGEVCTAGVCGAGYIESTPTATDVPFIDACAAAGHTVNLPSLDDSSVRVALPFAFQYWATSIASGSMINVATNGFLNMDGVTSSPTSGTIPSTSTPNSTIAAGWRDLDTRATGVCVATVGTMPNRQFVVEWADATNHASTTQHLTFEIILTETTNTIDIVYSDATGASSSTIGVEDSGGLHAFGACTAGATSCIPTSTMRARFTLAP